jgi:hypothetical protein
MKLHILLLSIAYVLANSNEIDVKYSDEYFNEIASSSILSVYNKDIDESFEINDDDFHHDKVSSTQQSVQNEGIDREVIINDDITTSTVLSAFDKKIDEVIELDDDEFYHDEVSSTHDSVHNEGSDEEVIGNDGIVSSTILSILAKGNQKAPNHEFETTFDYIHNITSHEDGYCAQFIWLNEIDNCCDGRNDNCYVYIADTRCYCDSFCTKDCCPDIKTSCPNHVERYSSEENYMSHVTEPMVPIETSTESLIFDLETITVHVDYTLPTPTDEFNYDFENEGNGNQISNKKYFFLIYAT